MASIKRAYFRDGNSLLAVEVGDDGYVNVSATGCTDIKTFAEFAHAVLKASNEATGDFVGLPEDSRPLESP